MGLVEKNRVRDDNIDGYAVTSPDIPGDGRWLCDLFELSGKGIIMIRVHSEKSGCCIHNQHNLVSPL